MRLVLAKVKDLARGRAGTNVGKVFMVSVDGQRRRVDGTSVCVRGYGASCV